MKKQFSAAVVIALLVAVMPWAGYAQSKEEVNYFSVKSSITKPVTIKTNLGTFSFYDSYTLTGHIYSIEAFDAKGNRIVNTQPAKKAIHSNSGNEYWYVFSDIYSSSSSSTSNSTSSSSTSTYTPSSSGGINWGSWMDRFTDDDFDNKIYIGAGYGTKYGSAWGLGITAKPLMGIIGFSAGAGYDPRCGQSFSASTATWYGAMSFGYENFGIALGANNRYYPKNDDFYKGLVMMFDFNLPLSQNFGLDFGFGTSIQLRTHGDAAFEWSIGLTYNLLYD